MKKLLLCASLLLCLLAACGQSDASVSAAGERLYREQFQASWPDAQWVEEDDFHGYILRPMEPSGALSEGEPAAQQSALELQYYCTAASGQYHVFWLYTRFTDDPETGEGHSSTLNFFAVPADGAGDILVERTDWSSGLTPDSREYLDASEAELDRQDAFWDTINRKPAS